MSVLKLFGNFIWLFKYKNKFHISLYRQATNNNVPNNFTKGQLVAIAHGEVKRIEDLRTEDFITASEKTHLQVIDTTVVKITPGQSKIIVTLSYGSTRQKVCTIHVIYFYIVKSTYKISLRK